MPQALDFHRFVRPADLSRLGQDIVIEADQHEKVALAEALDLVAIEDLTARLHLVPLADGLSAEGTLRCRLTYRCVATLDPFEAEIEERIERQFRRLSGEPQEEVELAYEDEPPDAISPEGADIGAFIAESLSLALDPYPRKPGAVFAGQEQSELSRSPFAALAKWKGEGEE